jgi:hypothetical protein
VLIEIAFSITLKPVLMLRTTITVTSIRHLDVDLDTLPMPELLSLFENHMHIYGRSQLVGVIRNTPVDTDLFDDSSDHGDESEEEPSEGDSDSFDTDSSDSSQEIDIDENSDDESVLSAYMGVIANEEIRLHPPVEHHYRHCPPFETLQHTLFGACDCSEYGMIECCQINNFSYFHNLKFDEEYQLAMDSIQDEDRLGANE